MIDNNQPGRIRRLQRRVGGGDYSGGRCRLIKAGDSRRNTLIGACMLCIPGNLICFPFDGDPQIDPDDIAINHPLPLQPPPDQRRRGGNLRSVHSRPGCIYEYQRWSGSLLGSNGEKDWQGRVKDGFGWVVNLRLCLTGCRLVNGLYLPASIYGSAN